MDVDTIDPMVVPAPDGPGPSPVPPSPRRGVWLLVPLVVLALGLPGLLNADLPYYAISPGSAKPVTQLVRAPADKVHMPQGQILYATVSIGPLKPLQLLRAKLDRDTEIIGQRKILGKSRPQQYTQENLQAMDESKETAIAVALRRLGYTVTESGSGALVEQVEDKTPAAGHVAVGDVITAVDGKPTNLADQAVALIRAHRPGDTATFSVRAPDGATREERVQLTRKKSEEVAFLGVVLRTKDHKLVPPFDIKIETSNVGGPSAGLAFTLGVLDDLTPGELTGGHTIAVTGTIELDGTVGPVGGVAQKTAAVCAAGAEYFLVPPDELKTAQDHACRRLHVVKVENLDQAVAALGRIGGDVAALGAVANGAKG